MRVTWTVSSTPAVTCACASSVLSSSGPPRGNVLSVGQPSGMSSGPTELKPQASENLSNSSQKYFKIEKENIHVISNSRVFLNKRNII